MSFLAPRVTNSSISSGFTIACVAMLIGGRALPQGTVKAEQKVSATVGGFFGDLDPSDTFAIDLESLGDLDGDGTNDLVVGARQDDDGGTDQGAVWILFLNPDGTVKDWQKISETTGGFGGGLDPSDIFGRAVASPGDIDGDGIQDLAVGAAADDDGGFNQGAAWILFLNADGTVRDEQKISETAGGFGGVLDGSDFFGTAMAGLGDLDGDGVVDLAVGAYLDDDGGTDRGAVWILFLNDDGTVKAQQKISQTAGGFGGTLAFQNGFGGSLGFLGDLDGDGSGDLAVGALNDDDGGTDQGALWILFLNPNGTVKAEQKISETQGGFGGVLDPFDYMGHGIAGLGDLDGDGVQDLAVGALWDDDGGTNQGAVWVLFLNSDGTVKAEQKISATSGGFAGDLDPEDRFGVSVASLGDLDGDGTIDLAVGADFDGDGGFQQGAVWVLFLTAAWSTREPLPAARGALTAEVLDGKIHVLGGDSTWVGCSGCSSNRHDVFDPATGLWTTAALVPDMATWGSASAVLDGKLYLLAGWNGDNQFRVYHAGSNTWSSIAAADMRRGGATVLNGAIHCVGQARPGESDTHQSFDPGDGFWVTREPLPEPVLGVQSEALGGKIYVVGAGTALQVYDPATGWSYGPDLPVPVYAPAATVVGGRLCVFGGSTAGNNVPSALTNEVQIYDPATNAWTLGPRTPTARYWAAAASVGNRAFVIGGFDSNDMAVAANEEWHDELSTQLSFGADLGFGGEDGVSPDTGLPERTFEFRVDYMDAGGLLPEAGSPKLRLDLNADGDTLDSGEGEYVMLAADADADVTDGKTYFYTLELADPGAGSYRYSFQARNSSGEDAVGAPTNWRSGPDVRDDLYDLALFADDILFSNPAPGVGETFTVTVRFDNESLLPVDDVSVVVESEGVPIHSTTFAHLDPGATGAISFPWAFAQDGFYPLRAYVDYDQELEEWNELNNNATRPIVVGEYTLPGSIELLGLPAQTTFTAGGYVGFSGTARYLGTPLDPPPAVQGGTLTFRPSWGAARVAYTNSAGQFSISFPGPATGGTYLVEVEATDYTLTSTYEVILNTLPPPMGPNLRVFLTCDVAKPCVGEMVTLSWSVTNTGNVASPTSRATLETPGTALLADVVIPGLAPGQTHVPSNVVVTATAAGTRSFTARVDPDAEIAELTELDNASSTSFQAYPTCFEWDPDYVRFSPAPHCVGEPVSMSFLVRNSGCFDAPATLVRFRIDGSTLADQPFAALAGKGEQRGVSFVHSFGAPGTYTVSFELDPLDAAAECNDANNLISATIQVGTCPMGGDVDYRLDACALSASDDEPTSGQAIHFRASVTNAGTLDGGAPLVVRFLLDGAPVGPDVTTSGALLAGASELVQSAVTWTVDFSPHLLEVVLDPDALEAESSEVNNGAARVLPYELHPVPIPSCPGNGASVFSTCSPCVSDLVTILGYVINTGLFSVSGPVDVSFEDGFGGSPTVLGSAQVMNLRSRGECPPVSLDFASIQASFTQPGSHPITFRVDPDDVWPEYAETNNALTRSLSVSSCIPAPDLYLRSEHINPEDLNPAPGETLDWVILTVFNQGQGPASSVTVDLNIDSQPLCTNLALGTIAPGASNSVQCSVPWLAPAGPPNLHVLQAIIEPAPEGESNLANNSATRAIVVGPAPDLYVSAEDIQRGSGSGAGSFSAWIRVANGGPVAGSALLSVSVLDPGGQATLVEQIPVTLPPAAAQDSEVWVLSSWQTNATAVRVRAALSAIAPADYDETNDQAERSLELGPRASRRRM